MTQFQNPVAARYRRLYNSLNKEQQEQWDNIDNLPKEQCHLKKIKRVRKPELSAGAIFAMLLPEDIYMFGKIIEDNLSLPHIDEGYFVAFLSTKLSKDINDYPKVFCYEKFLIGPMIIGDGLWKNGTFFTVSHEPLTDAEMSIDYGFFHSNMLIDEEGKLTGIFLNVHGEEMDDEPQYLEWCAYKTIFGIERSIRQVLIVQPDLLN